MTSFPDLLVQAFHDCNRRGKTIGFAILVAGAVHLVLSGALMASVISLGMDAVRDIAGPGTAQELQRGFTEMTTSMGFNPLAQQRFVSLIQDVAETFEQLPPDRQRVVAAEIAGKVFMVIMPLGILFFLAFIAMSYWMTAVVILAANRNGTFSALAREAMRWILPLLGVSLLIMLIFVAWLAVCVLLSVIIGGIVGGNGGLILAFVSGILAFLIGWFFAMPYLALPTVILVQDRTGIMESIRRGIRLARGHWVKIAFNILGMGFIVGCVLYVIQLFFQFLIGIAVHFSPSAIFIGQLVIFVTFMGAAYQTMFLVRLKETVEER